MQTLTDALARDVGVHDNLFELGASSLKLIEIHEQLDAMAFAHRSCNTGEAALATVQRWRYVPGKRAGVPEAMWFNVPIRFVLD